MQENPAQRGQFKSDDDHRYRPATTTTSLASKNKLEVVLFGYSNVFATAATFLASKREPEVVLFSCFNTSATTTSLASNQTRARGGFLGHSNASATTTTSLASQCELEVAYFGCFNTSATTTSSLTSKCELAADLWGVSTLEGILPVVSTTTGQCETYTPPRSKISLPFGVPGTAYNLAALFTTPQ